MATTRYRKGLGETVADLKSLLPSNAIDKESSPAFIWVGQTSLAALREGYMATLHRTR
jgi:hypothetical protein